MKKSLIALIVGLLALVGVGSAATYYFMTNTPKNLYLASEQETMNSFNDYFNKRFENEMKLQEKMMNESYTTSANISADIPENVATLTGVPKSVFDSSSLKFEISHDPKKAASILSVSPKIADTDLGAFNWSADKDNQYIATPLFKDVLSIPNDKIISTIEKISGEKMDPSQGLTDEALNLNEILSNNQLSQKDIKDFQERYMKVIVDNLKDDQFKKEKAKVKVFEEEKTLDKVTMTLKDADTKKLVLAILEEAKKDEKLKALIQKQGQVTNFGKEIDKAIKETKDAKTSEFPAITSIIYVDGKQILKRDLTMKDAEGAGLNLKGVNTLKDNLKLDYSGKSLDNEAVFSFKGESKGEKDADQDNYTATFSDTSNQEFKLDFKNTSTRDGNKRNDKGALILTPPNDAPFNIDYNNQMDTDLSNNSQKQKADFAFELNGYPVKVKMDADAKLKTDVKVKADGAKDLSTMSDSDIQSLQQEIQQKAEDLMTKVSEKMK